MPKRKDGAVIVGYVHTGLKNADAVIDELERQGIKTGNVVAKETSLKGLQEIESIIDKGKLNSVNNRIDFEIAKAEDGLRTSRNRDNLLVRIAQLKSAKSDLVFQSEVVKFLRAKGVKIVCLDSNAMAGKISDFWLEKHELLAKGKRNKKKEKIEKLVSTPIREKHWRKVLQGTKPNFVLAGAAHLPAIKKMVSYSKAVDLSVRPLRQRIRGRFRGEMVRMRYKLIQTQRKRRRAKAQRAKRKPRKPRP